MNNGFNVVQNSDDGNQYVRNTWVQIPSGPQFNILMGLTWNRLGIETLLDEQLRKNFKIKTNINANDAYFDNVAIAA